MRITRRHAAVLAAILALAAGAGLAALLHGAREEAASPPAATPENVRPAPSEDDAPTETGTTSETEQGQPANEPAPETPEETTDAAQPESEPFLVGFMDDASFRWHPARARMLDRAKATGARLIRAFVRWDLAAPKRPAPGRAPFVKPRLHDLDELVANTKARGMEVLITIWGTPAWANGGRRPNYAPTDVDDLRDFAHGLAERYPGVRRYLIWNEPNTNMFLAPQFDAQGRSVAPHTYAELYRAAYEGIKEANEDALVAIGGTGSHGRDEPSPGPAQDRHSPARFAQLLAQESPRLEFDAWAHQPYPISPNVPPDGKTNWPNVGLTSLKRFGRALDVWFEREKTPIWITELGYEAAPAEPWGVPEPAQAAYAKRAIRLSAAVERVKMFVWFTFADSNHNTWQSGLIDRSGKRRPAYESFTDAVRAAAAREK